MPSAATRESAGRRADRSGILLMLGATLFFMSTNVFVKFLADELSVFQVTWGRMLFHWLCFLPLFLLPRYRGRVRPNRPRLQLVRSAILYCTNTLFFGSLFYLTLATGASIMYAGPLILVVLSVLFLGEKVGPRRWAAVAFGFAGVLVIMQPGGAFHWAMLLPLGASVGFALYQIVTRAIAADDHPFTTMFWTPVVGIAAASAVMPFVWQNPSPLGWLWLACSGVTAGAGQFLLIAAFARSEASLLAPFGYSTLVWAALFGIAIFGNYPDVMTLLGAGIVVLAGLYIWVRERQLGRAGGRAGGSAGGSGSPSPS